MAAGGMTTPQAGQPPPGYRWDAIRGSYVPASPKAQVQSIPSAGSPPAPTLPNVPLPMTPTPSAAQTFQPPATDPRIESLTRSIADAQAAPQAAPNPQIAALMQQLQQQVATSTTAPDPVAAVRAPDLSGLTAQSGKLGALIEQLMRGEGVGPIGDVATDPEAAAYRVAKQRAAERAREAEANRAAATPGAMGGDFDSRLAQIQEATGEDIAGFEGALAGRRKTEAGARALSGAQLSLADLDRQTRAEQDRFQAELMAATAKRGSARENEDALQRLIATMMASDESGRALAAQERQFGISTQQQLLDTLLGQQGREQEFAMNAPEQALRRALLEQDVIQAKRQPTTPIPGAVGGLPKGTRFSPFGGVILPGTARSY